MTGPKPQQHARHSSKRFDWLLWLVGGLSLLMLTLPIIGLLWRAFTTRVWQSGISMTLIDALLVSISTTLLSVIIIVIAGTPLAYLLARQTFPFKSVINTAIELPIVLPPAVAGLALLLTFGRRGFVGVALEPLGIVVPFTTAAVIFAQVFVAMPFYVRSASNGIRAVPIPFEEAALVDGASRVATFRFITLPLAGNAIFSGLLLSWARALGEFGATLLFAGSLQGRTQTMPLLIYNALEQDINTAIWAAILLIIFAALALGTARWVENRQMPIE